MELLGLVLIWPLLLLVVGVVLISAVDVASAAAVVPVIVFMVIVLFGIGNKLGGISKPVEDAVESADRTRRGTVAFSIALLLPLFVKYFLDATDRDIAGILIAMVFAFGVFLWGMFIKNNKVLTYANILGGGFSIIYLYFQLWSLGQLAQVVGSAAGLLIAVVISVVKLRDKLK